MNKRIQTPNETLLYRNRYGLTIVRKDFVRRSHVIVKLPNGASCLSYRFNNIPDVFDSPYMSWANLSCCGGFGFSDKDYLLHSVHHGQKLYAGLGPNDNIEALPFDENIISGTEVQLRDSGIYAKNLFICRKGKILNYYDLNEVFSHYEKLGYPLSEKEKSLVKEYCNREISDFSNYNTYPYDYSHPRSLEEWICNGLLLGYPIESTVDLLCFHYGGR